MPHASETAEPAGVTSAPPRAATVSSRAAVRMREVMVPFFLAPEPAVDIFVEEHQ
jgi:hypothetical protein